jgi:hypothetical protein
MQTLEHPHLIRHSPEQVAGKLHGLLPTCSASIYRERGWIHAMLQLLLFAGCCKCALSTQQPTSWKWSESFKASPLSNPDIDSESVAGWSLHASAAGAPLVPPAHPLLFSSLLFSSPRVRVWLLCMVQHNTSFPLEQAGCCVAGRRHMRIWSPHCSAPSLVQHQQSLPRPIHGCVCARPRPTLAAIRVHAKALGRKTSRGRHIGLRSRVASVTNGGGREACSCSLFDSVSA